MENNTLLSTIPILWKWKYEILTTIVIGGALISVILLLQPNYYKAETTFYPVSNTLLKPIVEGTERDLQYFGDDHDVDRLLSIAKSGELTQEIIRDFELAKVYQIDENTTRGRIKMKKKFDKLYSVTKTQHDAIRVSVEDRVPKRAAELANAIRDKIDARAILIVKSALADIIKSIEKGRTEKQDRLNTITEEIKELRKKYRIYDTQSQAEALATIEIQSPNSARVNRLIDDYTTGITDVIRLEYEQEEMNKLLVKDSDNLEKIKATHDMSHPSIHIVESAYVPDEKSRPRRTLIVLGSAFLLTILSCLSVLAIEKFREINWEAIT